MTAALDDCIGGGRLTGLASCSAVGDADGVSGSTGGGMKDSTGGDGEADKGFTGASV